MTAPPLLPRRKLAVSPSGERMASPEADLQLRLRESLGELRRLMRRLRQAERGLPPADPAALGRMERHEVPFSLAEALRKDVRELLDYQLAEAATVLESAVQLDERRLRRDWLTWKDGPGGER